MFQTSPLSPLKVQRLEEQLGSEVPECSPEIVVTVSVAPPLATTTTVTLPGLKASVSTLMVGAARLASSSSSPSPEPDAGCDVLGAGETGTEGVVGARPDPLAESVLGGVEGASSGAASLR
jgi:hypothetical protein